MQFLMLGRRVVERFGEAEFAPLLEPEAEQARRLYADGVFRQVWGRQDVPGAAALIEAGSLEEAQRHVASLPLVQRGMLETQIIPLTGYRGFGPRG
jgi:muconolactone delta-isomerase